MVPIVHLHPYPFLLNVHYTLLRAQVHGI
jgi:hypothetical protein